MNEFIGSQIDRYSLISLVGEGGMASVYQAEDRVTTRTIALKIIHPHLARQERFRQQFLQEAQTAANLQHPGIIDIYQVGEWRELLFIAMAFIADGSLDRHIQLMQRSGRQFTHQAAAGVVIQIAEALHYAHEQGVVHGDIKPGNILLKPSPSPLQPGRLALQAVITDFGLATLMGRTEDTTAQHFLGSLAYMSPEQCMARPLDGRSDLYALGIILYQLVTGQLPFEVKSPTEAVMNHLNEMPTPPGQLRPDLPQPIEDIILKALAKDPSDRFQTGGELAQSLQEALRPGPVQPTPTPAPAVNGDVTQLHPMSWGELPQQMTADIPWNNTADQLIIGRPGQTAVSQPLNKDELIIGRGRNEDIVLPERGISRRHARLEQVAAGWQITDLGSTNGTYLEGNRLLPDVAEEWPSHQTIRIGSYYLQWRPGIQRTSRDALLPPIQATSATTADEPEIHRSEQLSVVVAPEQITVQPGEQVQVTVTLFNQSDIVDHYQIEMPGLPSSWVTLPLEPLQLLPGESGTLLVFIQPPHDSSALAGHHNFNLNIVSSQTGEDVVGIATFVTITPFEQFTIDMQPRVFQNRGKTQVLVTNEGNLDSTFHVIGRDPGEALHFIDPRKEQDEKMRVRQEIEMPTTPRWLRPLLRLRPVRALPFMRDARRAQSFIRRWSRIGKQFGVTLPKREQKEEEEAQPAMRLATLHSRMQVPAGRQGTVELMIEPLERPFLPKPPELLPFEVQVSTATSDPQTLTGQVEVTSVVTPRQLRLAALLLLLLLLPCAWLLYSLVVGPAQEAATVRATEEAAATLTAVVDINATGTAVAEINATAQASATAAASATEQAASGEDGEGGQNGEEDGEGSLNGTPGVTSTVTVTATPTPSPIVAIPDSFATTEDVIFNSGPLSVLANDIALEGNVVLTAVLNNGPANGTLTLNANGTFIYQPNANFNGVDAFSYVAQAGSDASLPATVLLNVAAVNDPPVAVPDRFDTDKNTSLDTTPLTVLSNDQDVEGGTLTALLNRSTENGTLVLNGDGTFEYTPNFNFSGSDTFTYFANDGVNNSNPTTVIITVGGGNSAPVANNDAFSVNEDGTLANDVLSNDNDGDGDALTAVLVSPPANGTLVLNPDGTFTYKPSPNFNGSDSFTYRASDGFLASNTATVIITINAVNDPPIAATDRYSMTENTVLNSSTSVLDNDTDIDSVLLTAVLDAPPENGTLAFNSNGHFVYTPNLNFFGSDTFTYHANDGQADSNIATVIITVGGLNSAPVAVNDNFITNQGTVLNSVPNSVLNNDSDPDGDTLTAVQLSNPTNGTLTFNADGTFIYTPNASFFGSDTFTYRATDGLLNSNTATVAITVTQGNTAPVADNDSYTTDENVTLNSAPTSVLDNDSDADGDGLTAVLVTNPSSGSLAFNSNGTFVYTPNPFFNGSDSFTYRANDGQANSNIATVTITVNPNPEPAIAFQSTRDGLSQIYIMNPDGSSQTRIASDNRVNTEPAWSPNGRRLAFASAANSGANRRIDAINMDGTVRTTLINIGDNISPAWSPDGTRIAFISTRNNIRQVWIMNANGDSPVPLTANPDLNYGHNEFVWSPDSTQIAVIQSLTSTQRIMVLSAIGNSSAITLTTAISWPLFGPAWSPNSNQIAYSQRYIDLGLSPNNQSCGGGYVCNVYLVNANGNTQPVNVSNDNVSYGPIWSPDGSQLAFVSERQESPDIYLLPVGGNAEQLTNNSVGESQLAWSPDGSRIAFTGNSQLYIVSVIDGIVTQLTTSGSNTAATWQPN